MIKHILFYNSIDTETVQELIDEMDLVLTSDLQIDGVVLHFSSNGGALCALNILVDYLNTYSLPLEVKVCDAVMSAGFLFLLDLEDHISITYDNTCFGMVHLSDSVLSSRETRNREYYSSETKFLQEKCIPRIDDEAMDKYIRCGLPKEYLENIEHGKDIYIDKEDLEKYVDNYKNSRAKDRCLKRIEELKDEIKELELAVEELNAL